MYNNNNNNNNNSKNKKANKKREKHYASTKVSTMSLIDLPFLVTKRKNLHLIVEGTDN